jgi:hypothetical protein
MTTPDPQIRGHLSGTRDVQTPVHPSQIAWETTDSMIDPRFSAAC